MLQNVAYCLPGALYVSKAVYYEGPNDGSELLVLTIAGAGTTMTAGQACAIADFTLANGGSAAAGTTCTENSATEVTLALTAGSVAAAGRHAVLASNFMIGHGCSEYHFDMFPAGQISPQTLCRFLVNRTCNGRGFCMDS